MGVKCFMVEDFNDLWIHDGNGTFNVGAMIFRNHPVEYFHGRERQPHLLVVTPDGIWCADCPESDGPGLWDWTGEPPNVTATPSIFINRPTGWHGFLTDGELVG